VDAFLRPAGNEWLKRWICAFVFTDKIIKSGNSKSEYWYDIPLSVQETRCLNFIEHLFSSSGVQEQV